MPTFSFHLSFETARLGRAPSVFKAENVQSVAGNLQLRSAYDPTHSYPANPPSMPAEPRVYGNWTTSFCESRTLARYGYFEVHARYVLGVGSGRHAIAAVVDGCLPNPY